MIITIEPEVMLVGIICASLVLVVNALAKIVKEINEDDK